MSNYLFKNAVTPLSNVDGNVVNVDSSNWPGRFGSIETSRQFALPDNFSNNANAANASLMTGGRKSLRKKIKNIISKYRMHSSRKSRKGRLMSLYRRYRKSGKSGKSIRRSTRRHRRGGNTILNGPIVSSQSLKLINGTNAYNSSGPVAGVANPYGINSMLGGRRRRHGRKHSRRSYSSQKGGYSQYNSNIPMTTSYSTGGQLGAANLGMANPVPFQVLSNCTNCVDNYNYNTNRGFQV
jgi:hypothetical protein